jgi:hypothetical protein
MIDRLRTGVARVFTLPGEWIRAIRASLKRPYENWQHTAAYLHVPGLDPIPMTGETTRELEAVLAPGSANRPESVTFLWDNGDRVRVWLSQISAITTKGARWRFGPKPSLPTFQLSLGSSSSAAAPVTPVSPGDDHIA